MSAARLLTAGSFAAQGDLSLWWVIGLTICGAALGDHPGYSIGRWGSQRLITRFTRWGGSGIFLSHWLLTPIGPLINLTSGGARYPLLAFFCFDVAGEAMWVSGYVALGWLFSDQVQNLSNVLGNLTWVIVGSAAMIALLWLLMRQSTPSSATVAVRAPSSSAQAEQEW